MAGGEALRADGTGQDGQVLRKSSLTAGELVAVKHFVDHVGREAVHVLGRVQVHVPDGGILAAAEDSGVAVKFLGPGQQLPIQTGFLIRV